MSTFCNHFLGMVRYHYTCFAEEKMKIQMESLARAMWDEIEPCNLYSESLHHDHHLPAHTQPRTQFLSPCSKKRRPEEEPGESKGFFCGRELRPKNEMELTRPKGKTSFLEAGTTSAKVGWARGRNGDVPRGRSC